MTAITALADCCFPSGIFIFTHAAAVERRSSAKARGIQKSPGITAMLLFLKICAYDIILCIVFIIKCILSCFVFCAHQSLASVCALWLVFDMVTESCQCFMNVTTGLTLSCIQHCTVFYLFCFYSFYRYRKSFLLRLKRFFQIQVIKKKSLFEISSWGICLKHK